LAASAPGEPEGVWPSSRFLRVGAAEYNAFIASLELQQIRLAAAEIYAPNPPEQRQIAPILQMDDATFLNEEERIKVRQALRFIGNYQDEPTPALRVKATYEVTYTASEAMTEELFEEFRHRNLPVNVWPYYREYLQSTLCRVGWPVLTLPAFKRAPGRGSAKSEEDAGEET
jgi:hypothetical protein